MLEAQRDVIGIAHHDHVAACMPPSLLQGPRVEDVVMALNLIRWIWWVVAVPLCFGTMVAVVDPTPRRVLACDYPLVVGLLRWQWRAAARRGESDGRAGGEKTR